MFGLSLTTSRWATGLPGWCGPRSMNRTDLWTFIEGDPRFLWTLIPRIVRLVVREVEHRGSKPQFLKNTAVDTDHPWVHNWALADLGLPPLLKKWGSSKGGSPFRYAELGRTLHVWLVDCGPKGSQSTNQTCKVGGINVPPPPPASDSNERSPTTDHRWSGGYRRAHFIQRHESETTMARSQIRLFRRTVLVVLSRAVAGGVPCRVPPLLQRLRVSQTRLPRQAKAPTVSRWMFSTSHSQHPREHRH